MAVNSIPESDLPFLFSSFLPGVAACLTVPSKGGVGGDPLWEEGEGERWEEEKAIKLVPGKEEEEETGKRRNEMNSFNPPPLPFFFVRVSLCLPRCFLLPPSSNLAISNSTVFFLF